MYSLKLFPLPVLAFANFLASCTFQHSALPKTSISSGWPSIVPLNANTTNLQFFIPHLTHLPNGVKCAILPVAFCNKPVVYYLSAKQLIEYISHQRSCGLQKLNRRKSRMNGEMAELV